MTPVTWKPRRGATLCLYLLLPAITCALADTAPPKAEPSRIVFTDVTPASGIRFEHSFGDGTLSNLIEGVGSGVAWLDFDQDGWVDLYLLSGAWKAGVSDGPDPRRDTSNRLFRNKRDGTFEDVTAAAGVSCASCFSMGVAVGDYDNDGWPDLYVANHGPNALFRNLGNGRFADVTRRSGTGDPACSVAAAWLDADGDGLLDLYVGNYVTFDPGYRKYYSPDGFPGPLAYAPEADRLYRNLGSGRFEDATAAAGIPGGGRAMSVAGADFDADGDVDIYVTNDAAANYLLRNDGKGRFEEIAALAGVALNGLGEQTASMAVDFGDYDGDGRIDIFVSDNALSSLFRFDGRDFEDVTAATGIAGRSAQFEGWGAFFFDYDNDGDLDIFKANSDLSRPFGQEDQILENVEGRYRDVSPGLGPYFREERMGRGSAPADYDNDGDLDVIVSNLSGAPVLLRNDGGSTRTSLSLRLAGRESNRDGVGAQVRVTVGGRTRVLPVRAGGGYLSQGDPRLHVGLGSAAAADLVEVTWPSGRKQTLRGVRAGGTITIEEAGD